MYGGGLALGSLESFDDVLFVLFSKLILKNICKSMFAFFKTWFPELSLLGCVFLLLCFPCCVSILIDLVLPDCSFLIVFTWICLVLFSWLCFRFRIECAFD